MCPPAPVDIPVDITSTKFWTDEDIIKSLKDIKSGSPLPENVIADVDPYQIMPSNLPEGIWFFCSEVNKKAQHGFWKATGEACDIYSNSSVTGWRTTLEFYEGKPPHGQKTNWVMQEYWITEKELGQTFKPKVSGVLCRVCMSDAKSPGHEQLHQHGLVDMCNTNPVKYVPTTVPNAGSNTEQLSKSESHEKKMNDETRPQAHAGRSPNRYLLDNFAVDDYILNEDYLELNDLLDDLADPDSNSSSSVNSSFRTINSEEYFDSEALLRELEQDNKDPQKKSSSFKFIHSSNVKPKEVVLLPAIVGSLTSGSGSKSPTEVTHKKDQINEGTSSLPERASSSSSSSSSSSTGSSNGSLKGEKKGLVGKMKKLKNKYLCCHSNFST